MSTQQFERQYRTIVPTRAEVDALRGSVVIEFGAPWCPICRAAQHDIEVAVHKHPTLQHIKVEDGSGRPLGRSFRVKLWPTLVVLRDGVEVARVVRPTQAEAIEAALAKAAVN